METLTLFLGCAHFFLSTQKTDREKASRTFWLVFGQRRSSSSHARGDQKGEERATEFVVRSSLALSNVIIIIISRESVYSITIRITAMASAQALSRVLSSSSACSSSSSSSSSFEKKKTITTKRSSRGRRVIASSSSSSSSSSPERSHSPRRRKGCKPLKAILEPAVLEPASMDDDDENVETGKRDATKRTMTSNHENRSAATIVKTDFLVRFSIYVF